MNVKICNKCGAEKSFTDFSRIYREQEKRRAVCKQCCDLEQKRWRANGGLAIVARYKRKTRAQNREKTNRLRREEKRRLRLRVIEAYGGHCACCWEATIEFLAIDHIYNDGAAHRAELKKGGSYVMYLWLQRNGFPKDRFQLLCHNCNMAKAFYGRCPHTLNGSE